MPEPITLPETTAQQIERLGSVELVVGVVSCNQVGTVADVVRSAWTGLERGFPGSRIAVLHADSGSRDGTLERAAAAMPEGPFAQVPAAGGAPATRAESLRAIFSLAQRLGVRGCAVIDADVTSIAPDWVTRLLSPVHADQADFVASCYVRHRFDGALTTCVAYPFIRALYGKRLRSPVGGEFACSTRLLQRYLAVDLRQPDLARVGLDVWLTVQALTGGFRIHQALLGVKTQAPSGEASDLSRALSVALGGLFLEMERTVSMWQKVRGSEAVPISGARGAETPEPAAVDPQRALESFRLGERDLQTIWAPVLSPLALLELRKLALLPDAQFRFPDSLWARIVYDFGLAYHLRVMNRDHLLSAFAPLYAGWLAGFVSEMQTAAEPAVEERIERLCVQFEVEKPYLIARWRWPDRFSP